MAHITKALEAGKGKRFVMWLLLSTGWAMVVSLWLRNYGTPERGWLLIPLLLLLWNMTMEDHFDQTVDLRKVFVIALLLFRFSSQPPGLLALRWGSGCIVFLTFYIGALHYAHRDSEIQQESSNERLFPALAFLPSFALSLLIDSILYLAGFVLDTSLLPEIDTFFILAWAFMPIGLCIGLAVFAGWYIFHGLRYFWHKKRGYEVIEGIGFGDVIFLPLFTAFFGWIDFSLLYAAALLIHLLRYMIFRCFARKGEDRVCP